MNFPQWLFNNQWGKKESLEKQNWRQILRRIFNIGFG